MRFPIFVLATFSVFLTLALGACASGPEPELGFDTVELGGRATDNLTPDDDAAEAVGSSGFAGQLPASFPKSLPVPASSSVVRTANGSVTFGTEDSAEGVRGDLERQLARAGWSSTGTSNGGMEYRSGARTVSIRFTEEADRTLIRYQY